MKIITVALVVIISGAVALPTGPIPILTPSFSQRNLAPEKRDPTGAPVYNAPPAVEIKRKVSLLEDGDDFVPIKREADGNGLFPFKRKVSLLEDGDDFVPIKRKVSLLEDGDDFVPIKRKVSLLEDGDDFVPIKRAVELSRN